MTTQPQDPRAHDAITTHRKRKDSAKTAQRQRKDERVPAVFLPARWRGTQGYCPARRRRLVWGIPLSAPADLLIEPTYDPVAPGDVVAGRYRIERTIAVGGMGVVVAARHQDLDQPVALKILRPEILGNDEAVVRFMREARIAARLQNEHVARVFDVGTLESGEPYMVMELLSGRDLQQLVDARGPLPVNEAVDYALQALEALAEAHAQGIVHRDLKPSNIFIARRSDGSNTVKLLDFGISKGQTGIHAPADAQITNSRAIIGSPGYMSPEQMRSASGVDGRTDIWSMGVILYEILAGEPLFKGETVGAIMIDILQAPIPSLRERRADIPKALEQVIQRCLERDPDKRFPNAASLAQALGPHGSSWSRISVERTSAFVGGIPPEMLPASVVGDEKRRLHSQTAATFSSTASPPHPRRAFLVTAGVLMAAVGIGLGVWAHAQGPIASEPEAGSAATRGVATPIPTAPPAPAPSPTLVEQTAAPTATTPPAASQPSAAPSAPAVVAPKPPVTRTIPPKKRKPIDILGDRQ